MRGRDVYVLLVRSCVRGRGGPQERGTIKMSVDEALSLRIGGPRFDTCSFDRRGRPGAAGRWPDLTRDLTERRPGARERCGFDSAHLTQFDANGARAPRSAKICTDYPPLGLSGVCALTTVYFKP